ncbi:GerMN domain-containing protein [Halobacillus litoralis]|uniref:GerMN domain-containing protein n=1 Tax=Halobacillus litoralis TaxID=45668 RepID=UPI001CD715D3|nr:GerMN domain-containing protein [Halobacillus litoralis]MCA0969890.1 GerMN domain-containing protein [Halobacillus litoralis]
MKSLGFKPVVIAVFLLLATGLLSGCLFEGEQTLEKMDSPEQAVNTTPDKELEEEAPEQEEAPSEGEEGAEETEESSQTVSRELYLMDENGMIAPQTIELPASQEAAAQALEYLVKDGPVTNLLPTGFQAVLPAGTEVLGLNPESDGTMVVDLSEEFKNYDAKDEQKILEAMTYTLTQFEGIERIKLWINGFEQDVMPVDGTPVSSGVSRSNGINVQVSDHVDVVNTEAVTVYFPSQSGNHIYQVPVTTRVEKSDDVYSTVVQALLGGPALETSLLQPFNEGAEVLKTELHNGVLSLSFNEAILTGQDQPTLSDAALASLVMSLTDLEEVESVEVNVEGTEQVISELGKPLVEPVTRSDINQAVEM